MSDTPPQNPDEPLQTEEASGGYPEEQVPGSDSESGATPDRRDHQTGTPDRAALDDDGEATGNPANAGDTE